jgi:hypothetical protein
MSAPVRDQAVGPLAYAPRWARLHAPPHGEVNWRAAAPPEEAVHSAPPAIDEPCVPISVAIPVTSATMARHAHLSLAPDLVSDPSQEREPNTVWQAVPQLAGAALLATCVAFGVLWLSASLGESHGSRSEPAARVQAPGPEAPATVATALEAATAPSPPAWAEWAGLMLSPGAAIGPDQALSMDAARPLAATATASSAWETDRATETRGELRPTKRKASAAGSASQGRGTAPRKRSAAERQSASNAVDAVP